MKEDLTELTERFARALDREDYDVVRALLAPDCLYDSPDGPIYGADAIVESYRGAGKIAGTLFDKVKFQSTVLKVQSTMAEIDFTDYLTKEGQQYTYRCRQQLHFSPGGLIARIVHQEIGEGNPDLSNLSEAQPAEAKTARKS